MFPSRDFEFPEQMPTEESATVQDLELNTLFNIMANGDAFLLQVAKHAILSSCEVDLKTVLYRQAILKDCLQHESLIESLYGIAIEAIESKRKGWFGIVGRHPRGILYGAVELLELLMSSLRRLRQFSDEHASEFESEGFVSFFGLVEAELSDEYLAQVDEHLMALKFRKGVLLSADLGKGNMGSDYELRKPNRDEAGWFERVFLRKEAGYTFHLADRDEAGARALSDLQDRGLDRVAHVMAQAADHLLSFFVMLRTELAFYVGCLNLHRGLSKRKVAVCFPVPTAIGTRRLSFAELRDVSFVLTLEQEVVGNEVEADGMDMIIITGANQGGKSTFLRAVGLAQLMMQAGMFVAAEAFQAELCCHLFTHYKREEDVSRKSGKFDEELSRMSDMVDEVTPDSVVLFNESFAATNEREGSEIARQIVRALLGKGVKVIFVTHLHEFARQLWEEKLEHVLFLRAERQSDGQRTFKLISGEPLQTSFGLDLYNRIFEGAGERLEQ